MERENILFCIVLRSRHTGEETVLGGTYKTAGEAQEYIEKSVCERCNSVTLRIVKRGMQWVNKNVGYRWPAKES